MKYKILIALIAISVGLYGCSSGITQEAHGGTKVSNGEGACTVYIVEKDGYKFAVAVGAYKCAITQIQDTPQTR